MGERRVWEEVEITLRAQRDYANPYVDVEVWVDLEGPGFACRCQGFWDGGRPFRLRLTATRPGSWRWTAHSEPADPGLEGRSGGFDAVPWTEDELEQNPNRRGIVAASPNGHGLCYADGTPFFLLGDTWWSAGTDRWPWRRDGQPRPIGPGMRFQDGVRHRREEGFNCIAIIAAFPTWDNDGHPSHLVADDGLAIRSAWPQNGTDSAKTMRDEEGNRPFLGPGRCEQFPDIVPDFDRINPAYFRSLDRKIRHLNAQGFVPFLEAARRDVGPAWHRYHDWPDSYVRYLRHLFARCQAANVVLSPLHLDWYRPPFTLTRGQWRQAIEAYFARYGPPPFGQLVSTNIDYSTLEAWGDRQRAPWLTLHQVGNSPRDHAILGAVERIHGLEPPVPVINGEPYYAGYQWAPGRPEGGSEVDSRRARSAFYGNVFSGALAGHIYGAQGVWGGDVEPTPDDDLGTVMLWEGLQYASGTQMGHGRRFVESAPAFQELEPRRDLLSTPRPGHDGYRRWSFCLRSPDCRLYLLYFEKDAPAGRVHGLLPGTGYDAKWFDPRTGEWVPAEGGPFVPEQGGRLRLPAFPGGGNSAADDWALRLAVR